MQMRMGQSHGLAGVDLAPMKGDGRRLGNLEVGYLGSDLMRELSPVIAHRSIAFIILSNLTCFEIHFLFSFSCQPRINLLLSLTAFFPITNPSWHLSILCFFYSICLSIYYFTLSLPSSHRLSQPTY